MKCLLAIPAFNEATRITPIIESASKAIPEILVVDDGSVDGTASVASRAGARVVRHEQNLGKGEALKTAFAFAIKEGYDWLFTIDGDGQHDPDDLKGFFPLLNDYDLILGNRMTDSGRVPFVRRLANRTSSAIVSALCGSPIEDSQTGFRAHRVDLLRALDLKTQRFALESEIIIKAARSGFRIGHCRIKTIYGDEKSRFRTLRDSLKFLSMAVRLFFSQ